MATKKRRNKSQAIRDYLNGNPDAKPKEVIEALAKKRMKVSTALVSQIKYTSSAPKKKAARKKVRRKAARRNAATRSVSMESLLAAKSLADRLGGVEHAKRALDLLDQLTS